MSDQLPRRTLIDRLRAMNQALNEAGEEGSLFDPLFSAEFTLQVEFDTDPPAEDRDFPDETIVSWSVTFSSGHGPETAHLLSRKVTFSFRDASVTRGTLEDDSLQRHDFEDFEIGGPDEAPHLETLRLHLAEALPAQLMGSTDDLPRYIIRRVRQTHCKRGPKRCEKCRDMDREDFCLLDLQPPDLGMVQRRVIHMKRDGEDVWPEFEVERVFQDKAEAQQYALDNGISDAEWEE